MSDDAEKPVSRSRFEREKRARQEAEALLESKSRELFLANEELLSHQNSLEKIVEDRTAKLQAALEKAQAASEMRSRFLATMSHEIRTPLGGLIGMINLLRMEEDDSRKIELLDYATASGTALKRIVNDVLDFSKMEAGAFQFHKEAVDIRALTASVLAMAIANSTKDGLTFRQSISDTVPKLFSGDATRIRQVLSNLISNATRYSSEGLIEVRATAEHFDNGSLLRVEVEDQGVGIAPDEKQHLFKDFSQVQNKLTAAAQGTGLGLAISKRIIEGCGGTIGVESRFGKGSVFWFELPVEIVTGTSVEELPQIPEIKDIEALLKGAKVLLAEDNKINQKLIMTFLDRMGLDADLAENGRIAVEKFEPGKYDIILMDVAMPEMDGLQATRAIRDTWAADQIPPILALTAHVMETIEDESRSVGIDRVLNKPIGFQDLRMGIAEALRGRNGSYRRTTKPRDEEQATVLKLMSKDIAEGLVLAMDAREINALVSDFLDDGIRLLRAIRTGWKKKDFETVSADAHSLKGASGLLGFKDLSECASIVEDNADVLDAEDFAEVTDIIADQIKMIRSEVAS
ncbi:ATP-binding protein [Shimia thalassica]|uniref:ATP-binding protein n=1 Tax=Shimia thalassica TaxID=1715693 RepID=UPI001C0858EB|nr:ATP-binding protein [Shimia thalassica]MBU2941226.1 response regulator [Shimia thalassica]MDO6503290.1 ATP-binding protein [Shimia thalassica]